MPPLSLIDTDRIQSIFGEDKADIKDFFESFFSITRELLLLLTDFIQQEDAQKTKDLLHRLKGSAANAGAIKLFELFKQAEERAAQVNWRSLQDILPEIKNSLEHLEKEIATHYA